MSIWKHINQHISQASGQAFHAQAPGAVGGGCINSSYHLSNDQQDYFVKLNRAELGDMFSAEAEGLNEIIASQSIRAPEVICQGECDGQAYLVLEHIDLGQRGDTRQLGRELAAMHGYSHERYGWYRDNTIGSTPQLNQQHADWTEFWLTQRLLPQLEWAAQKGFGGTLQTQGEQLASALPLLLNDHQPTASLLHGDLWSGNYGFDAKGRPVIFDPAVYFGDRECDLAMTELFGGFAPDFYTAYFEAYPVDEGYALRKTLYNLYHILNHLNLFGGGYLGQCESMIQHLLAEVR